VCVSIDHSLLEEDISKSVVTEMRFTVKDKIKWSSISLKYEAKRFPKMFPDRKYSFGGLKTFIPENETVASLTLPL